MNNGAPDRSAHALGQRAGRTQAVAEREMLAAWILGSAPRADPPTEVLQRLLELSRREGVLALACHALSQRPDAPAGLQATFADAMRSGAAGGMLLRAECARVLGELAAAGIPVLLLKGVALGAWLYPTPWLRESSDIDLLFSTRAEAECAAALLSLQGYATRFQPGGLAQEFLCRRMQGAIAIDLDMHWRISDMPLFLDLFGFSELQRASIPLPALGPGARGLGPVHAFLHACVHRAANVCTGIGDRLKWLYDLHLLAARIDAGEWATLVQLCHARGVCGVVAEGIAATAAMFGAVVPESVTRTLATGRRQEALDAARLADWRYVQRQNFKALPSWPARMRWLRERLFPSLGYLRELYGEEPGRTALWFERLRRGIRRLSG